MSSILINRDSGITTLSISNPARKNAIGVEMSRQLLDAVEESIADESCRVVVLCGDGDNFCTGADLDPHVIIGFDVEEFLRGAYNRMVLAMRNSDKPFIAKVRGNCVGVGWNFALACDMVLCSEDARFSQIFSRIGLSSDGGGSHFLLQRIGYHRAYELLVSARTLDAATALDMGLVNAVQPAEKLDEAVNELAQSLARGPYVAIQHHKANLRAAHQGLSAALEAEAKHQARNFLSKDFMEGVMAFLQKRSPNWKGE